ncbi:AAA family ATPase [Methanobrevibacter curvatus]|uniref:Protein CR006 P-loop domain-containing protein n=1 Tax=Methanobrevibacter curvatus TaxID=49547 RepID=A0A166E9J2_9EURY|nr:AAA family ATPase [Methanobrevibacter curvatus]KZX16420.1 hypothetical protein MBCUR_00840 [Methanobrevibacter curvatus]
MELGFNSKVINMFQKINIKNLGIFKDYEWDKFIGKDKTFKRGNIFYGENYVGKTTFSKLFTFLETKKPPTGLKNPDFELVINKNKKINHNNIEKENNKVKVYNSDFKKLNLSFFTDKKDGKVNSFAILGSKNLDYEQEISDLEEKLSIINKELEDEKLVLQSHKKQRKSLDNKLEKKLADKASEIKRNVNLFDFSGKKKAYNITDIRGEIKEITENGTEKLSNDEKSRIERTIHEEEKINLDEYSQNIFNFYKELSQAEDLLTKELKPSKTINYLLEDSKLQNWVKTGVELNRKRSTCAFCGQNIDGSLFERLDSHFTKEVNLFEKRIDETIINIENQINNLENNVKIEQKNFYEIFDNEVNKFSKSFEKSKNDCINDLKLIKEKLENRRSNIFKLSKIEFDLNINNNEWNLSIEHLITELNNIIEQNNEYSKKIADERVKSRKTLRIDHINHFLEDIDYFNEMDEINKIINKISSHDEKVKSLNEEISNYSNKIATLNSKLSDERAAANEINNYLSNKLGHPSLKLDFIDKNNEFVIYRNGNEKAENLSEGEENLISFCYFLTTLKSISDRKNYTIFIDDPVTSLDSNNIFTIFALIDSEIFRSDFKQIFLTTHNLDLLTYLYKTDSHEGIEKFVIEKYFKNDQENGKIVLMPNYLKKYPTEFIYLFDQINIVYTEEKNESNFHSFHNFPNNARKFLESYLFFKFPDYNMRTYDKYVKFFNDEHSVAIVNRVLNEFSHTENKFDRPMHTFNTTEFKNVAKIILDTIRSNDSDQYNSFIDTISSK